ncbi:MAG: hypothetical protein M1820_007589 [Bogoriella megaspora]|nr:MAG: hypothetical protein M1820_007589 [Bogoriella megaspora]
MVKLALIVPVLLPLFSFASARHVKVDIVGNRHACGVGPDIDSTRDSHDVKNDDDCEHSWDFPMTSFAASVVRIKENEDCTIKFYRDDDCARFVAEHRLDAVDDGACYDIDGSNSTASGAKLFCVDGKHAEPEPGPEPEPSTITFTSAQSNDASTTILASAPARLSTRTEVETTTRTSESIVVSTSTVEMSAGIFYSTDVVVPASVTTESIITVPTTLPTETNLTWTTTFRTVSTVTREEVTTL